MRPSASSSPAFCDLLAEVRPHVVVRDLDVRLLGERLERELAGDGDSGLHHHLTLQVLGARAGRLQVGLDRDAAPLERADEAGEEVGGARLDERERRLHVRLPHELVHGGHPVGRVDLGVDLLAERRLDVRAQLLERVELARRAGQVVVDAAGGSSRSRRGA